MSAIAGLHWYAIYTSSRSEKIVCARLQKEGIDVFLPLIKKQRQWSDRKKWIDAPLFSSYIFVHIIATDYHKVLSVPGVVKFVTFEGKAVSIPEKQLNDIKAMLMSGYDIESTGEHFTEGDKIKISAGPLIGMQGFFVNYRGNQKVMIRIDQIGQNILVNVPATMLTKAK